MVSPKDTVGVLHAVAGSVNRNGKTHHVAVYCRVSAPWAAPVTIASLFPRRRHYGQPGRSYKASVARSVSASASERISAKTGPADAVLGRSTAR
jgi:hypothetical protein